MRILIIGAEGQLGRCLQDACGKANIEAICPPTLNGEVDVTKPQTVQPWITGQGTARVDAVINCAAVHDLRRCDEDRKAAYAVNVTGALNIVEMCDTLKIPAVLISTDYVFDGRKQRPYTEQDYVPLSSPLSYYGYTKACMELLALQYPRTYVVRTASLWSGYGSIGKGATNFVLKIVDKAARLPSGQHIDLPGNVVMSPTYGPHAAAAILRLIQECPPGLYHVANRGAVSWAEFGQAVIHAAGYNVTVRPIEETSPMRPTYSVLSVAKLAKHGIVMPRWLEGVTEHFYG